MCIRDSYYFVLDDFNERIGFIAFYPKGECMYLSKFYLGKDNRGKGYSKEMLDFIIDKARMCGLKGVTLNVNKNCLLYTSTPLWLTRQRKGERLWLMRRDISSVTA